MIIDIILPTYNRYNLLPEFFKNNEGLNNRDVHLWIVDDCSEKFKDAGTADFLTGLMQQHETIAWTLRRYFN